MLMNFPMILGVVGIFAMIFMFAKPFLMSGER